MKILTVDIETAPSLAYVWGLFKQNINIQMIKEAGYIMCWAAKWYQDDEVYFSSLGMSDKTGMIETLWELLDEADAVVSYNGERFDIPTINREFLEEGLTPPSPYAQIDLYKTVAKQFKFQSGKLDFVSQILGIGAKVKHAGFDLWQRCMEDDKDAWAEMEEYNIHDVELTEELYDRLKPWIRSHPNIALYIDTRQHVCSHCGSVNIQSRGTAKTKTQEYRRYWCKDCGAWSRERYTCLDKEKRKNVLTPAR